MQFAKSEGWNQVISEGDAKSCFGAISSPHSDPDWDISNVISNILSFKVIFSSCNFRWVNRDCNGAAHAAAKLSLRSSESLFSVFQKFKKPFVRMTARFVLRFK